MEEMLIPIVVFSNCGYGNDNCALIQRAREWRLEGAAVVYSDTGCTTAGWQARNLQQRMVRAMTLLIEEKT
jgi:hypothetical protein